MTKYKITEQHLDTKHGIAKLERDGFKREDISKALYAHTPGCNKDERAKLMKILHDRTGEC